MLVCIRKWIEKCMYVCMYVPACHGIPNGICQHADSVDKNQSALHPITEKRLPITYIQTYIHTYTKKIYCIHT